MLKVLPIEKIQLHEKLQNRNEISQSAIDEYAEAMKRGDEFPPILVFFDGINYNLVDGFHRYHAYRKAGDTDIECDVENGTFRDAQMRAASVNHDHGLPRTNADKWKAVGFMVDDFELSQWSNSEIAKWCHVSVSFVTTVRVARNKPSPAKVKYKDSEGVVREKAKAPGRPKKELEPVLKEEPSIDQEQQQAAIDEILAENETLKERLALAAMDATEEEKTSAAELIKDLKEQLRVLNIELVAVKRSRDQYQAENAQLKKQIAMQQKKLKQLESA